MAAYGQSITISYVAWDTDANAPKTGDGANHTLRWIKDGTSAAPTNSPSEVDATNAPGVYKLTLTAAECQCALGVLSGVSSTSDVTVLPITVSFHRLPTAAPGASGGLPTVDGSNYIAGVQGTNNHTLDDLADSDGRVDVGKLAGDTQSLADLKDFADTGYDPSTHQVEGVKTVDTTTTNTDMRGTDGANTTAPPTAAATADAVWDETIAEHAGAGSAGAQLTATTAPTAAENADAVWNEARTGHTTPGTFGQYLDAQVSSIGGAVGAGSRACTLTVTDDESTPLDGVAVWITTDSAGTNVVAGTQYTGATGEVNFLLDDGTYYAWKQLSGYTFTNPESFTVSG